MCKSCGHHSRFNCKVCKKRTSSKKSVSSKEYNVGCSGGRPKSNGASDGYCVYGSRPKGTGACDGYSVGHSGGALVPVGSSGDRLELVPVRVTP